MTAMTNSPYGRSMAAQPTNEEFTRFTIFLRTWNAETLSRDQMFSVAVSLFFIFPVTAVGFRSLRLGVLTLIPILTGIMSNFIVMMLLKLPFDVVTVMFSSVAIRVGIDDSIHLIIRYRRQIRIYTGKVNKTIVLAHTLKTTGRPILVSLALVTTTGGALVILPAILSFGD
jgi:predicted RND superfamily exporter protein